MVNDITTGTSVADMRSLSNSEIANLPMDRLALLVLADVDRTAAWNWRNWMLEFATNRDGAGLDGAQNALAEAWGWLTAHGMVATNGARGSYDFHDVYITRSGRAAMDRGLGYVRAVIRLDIDLVDVLEQRVRPQFLLGDFELAAFAAMREVEIAVRDLGGFEAGLIGVDLMNQAFRDGGPLLGVSRVDDARVFPGDDGF